MNVNVHIDRLILDGLSLTSSQGPLVQAAVEAELARLLTAGGLAEGLADGGALPSLRANAIQLTSDGNPHEIGRQIAQSVYGGIGHE